MKQQTTAAQPSLVPLVGMPTASAAIDTETLELLQTWAREDATDDPEKLREAQTELDVFKKSMNENRAASGERILYP